MPANKKAGSHPSYLKLGWKPSTIQRKKAYDKKYHSTPERKRYRAQLNKENRKAGTYGKMGSMDRSHTRSGFKLEHRSRNRARNGQDGKSTKA